MTKIENAFYHIHNGNYDAKFLTDSVTGERALLMESPIGLMRRPFPYKDFEDMIEQEDLSYTPITIETFQEYLESISMYFSGEYDNFTTYYKDGAVFERYGLTFKVYQDQFIVDLAGRYNDTGLRVKIADTDDNREKLSGLPMKIVETLGSEMIVEVENDPAINHGSYEERQQRLADEIKQLKATGLGIIGMVKSVQYNSKGYPELAKHSFYDIRELLS